MLAPVLRQGIGGTLSEQMGAALEEAVAAERVNADRPEAHLNLGLLADAASAGEESYRTALALDARSTPARANLADLDRELGRESAAEAQLEAGLAAVPQSAGLHSALGLAQVRGQRLEAAVESLRRAAALAPWGTVVTPMSARSR